jgi:hypothetical protein
MLLRVDSFLVLNRRIIEAAVLPDRVVRAANRGTLFIGDRIIGMLAT